jgi:hypothetical protein
VKNINSSKFTYHIDLKKAWPPYKRPSPPFGPGSVEILRSCPLRGCFDTTPGYEPRLGFAARIGIAFHRTIQSFNEYPLPLKSDELAAEESRSRFIRELRQQELESSHSPREIGLPRDTARIDRASEAVVVEALRIVREGGIPLQRKYLHNSPQAEVLVVQTNELEKSIDQVSYVEAEVPVRSNDGLFQGRVDRVEHHKEGIKLIDYKSAMRDDLPERYERQLQLYAYMWNDTRGEWPSFAWVIYPLAVSDHKVSIEPGICQQVASDSAFIVNRIKKVPDITNLASPGDVCKVCDYRPWCLPFWNWQSVEKSHSIALERSRLGIEGDIINIKLIDHHWRLMIDWRNCEVQIIAPKERLPHLDDAEPGMKIRVLDTPLRGLRYQPRAHVTEWTEVFIISNE